MPIDHLFEVYFHDEYNFHDSPVYHDPEGFLGSLNSIVIVFLGLQAGKILKLHQAKNARLIRLIAWGVVLSIIGGAFCGFSKNDGFIPINKNLWTTSFIFVQGNSKILDFLSHFIIQDIQNFIK